MLNVDEPWCYAKGNKPITRGKLLHNSTYMRLFKVVNLNKQKVEWWLPGRGRIGKGEVAIQPEQREFQSCKMRKY